MSDPSRAARVVSSKFLASANSIIMVWSATESVIGIGKVITGTPARVARSICSFSKK